MIVEGEVLALDRANVDTDQIIPARYLSVATKSGLGRYALTGVPDAQETIGAHPSATFIVAGENFGCGSSREHAVWALLDRGIHAVVAPSFARIFLENAYNNGLVPIALARDDVERVMRATSLRADVDAQRLLTPEGEEYGFPLDPLRKSFLLGGGFLGFMASKVDRVRAWERAQIG